MMHFNQRKPVLLDPYAYEILEFDNFKSKVYKKNVEPKQELTEAMMRAAIFSSHQYICLAYAGKEHPPIPPMSNFTNEQYLTLIAQQNAYIEKMEQAARAQQPDALANLKNHSVQRLAPVSIASTAQMPSASKAPISLPPGITVRTATPVVKAVAAVKADAEPMVTNVVLSDQDGTIDIVKVKNDSDDSEPDMDPELQILDCTSLKDFTPNKLKDLPPLELGKVNSIMRIEIMVDQICEKIKIHCQVPLPHQLLPVREVSILKRIETKLLQKKPFKLAFIDYVRTNFAKESASLKAKVLTVIRPEIIEKEVSYEPEQGVRKLSMKVHFSTILLIMKDALFLKAAGDKSKIMSLKYLDMRLREVFLTNCPTMESILLDSASPEPTKMQNPASFPPQHPKIQNISQNNLNNNNSPVQKPKKEGSEIVKVAAKRTRARTSKSPKNAIKTEEEKKAKMMEKTDVEETVEDPDYAPGKAPKRAAKKSKTPTRKSNEKNPIEIKCETVKVEDGNSEENDDEPDPSSADLSATGRSK